MIKACIVGVVACVLGISNASANPVRVEVTGEGCDIAELAPQIDQLVHADGSTTAKVEIAARGSGVEASVRFVDDDGSVRGPRVIAAADCKQLVESVAIVIAMAVRDDAATAPVAPVEAPPVAPTSVPHHLVSETSLNVIAETSAPRAPDQLGVVIGGGSRVSSNRIVAQVVAGVQWRRGNGSIGAEVRGDSADRASFGTGRVDVVRAQLSIAPCLHRGPLAICGLVAGGIFYGSSSGFAVTGAAYSPVIATGLRAGFEHALTDRVRLRAQVDAETLITTTVYEIDHMETWRSPRFELSAGIGVLAQFL